MAENVLHPVQRAREAGVTLVEVLVVLALIAVSAGVVSYALPSANSARDLDQEADLLAARLNIAAERSLVSGVAYRFDWSAQNYRLESWQDGAWQPAEGATFAAKNIFESGIRLTGHNGALEGSIHIVPSLLPAEGGVAELALSAGALTRKITFDGASARSEGVQR